MINILVPIAGQSNFFEGNEFQYSKPLVEILGKPMIELVISNLNSIDQEKRYIFIVNKSDCSKFHLDDTLRLITDNNCKIIKIDKDTKGAACSSLMAIEHINNDNPLIISNGDQVINSNLNEALSFFYKNNSDSGVISFESVHPKWSYVRVDENNKIIETAEKRPLSKKAIAGFYYFRQGKLFVSAAMNTIRKDCNVNGIYYIAPTMNELVIENLNLDVFSIKSSEYHNFYSPKRIQEYESLKGKTF